ncbi:hypothetical protein OY671_008767, partial [Metschnikowia pulcherrima]
MSEWSEIKARFKRPLSASFLCSMLSILSRDLFDAANKAYSPPDPATSHAIAVRVDKLAVCPYSRTASSRQNSGYRPLCYFSNDYPDVAFEAAAVVTRPLSPRTSEPSTDPEPDPSPNLYEGQMFRLHPPLRAYGSRPSGRQ